MALVRILVDGHGLLHSWEQIAPGKPRRATQSRQELITRLTQFYDAEGTPITIVFDGPNTDLEELLSTPEVEILYAKRGQTAGQALIRLSDRFRQYGTVLVVTDAPLGEAPAAHRQVESCANFIQTATRALSDLAQDISRYNQENDSKFHRDRP